MSQGLVVQITIEAEVLSLQAALRAETELNLIINESWRTFPAPGQSAENENGDESWMQMLGLLCTSCSQHIHMHITFIICK